LAIDARTLDGRVSVVIGKKESGKSHLAKILVTRLADLGAPVLVFDLNGEYAQLHRLRSGQPGPLDGRLLELRPGRTLRFSLRDLGKEVVSNLLLHILDTSGITVREFLRIWDQLEERGSLTLPTFFDALRTWRCNELVRDALLSRLHSLLGSNLITEETGQTLEALFGRLGNGGVAVVNLREVPGLTVRLTVEVLLSKLVQLAHRRMIPPVFLFAEEAHLYLRATYWEDLLTRMRHFGIFTTFITNQPDALSSSVYRQVDNIFAFAFSNEADVDTVARSTATDAETIRAIVRTLPPRNCLLLGQTVKEFPIVVQVEPLDVMTLGESRLFFREVVPLRAVRQAFNAS
jgi:DNA helicase HerA-like ATPase